ncbi:hypothetical protein ACJVDH_14955 [Pedobacter sp. AW1-32]|uniref:hypothetical protein n=1 Tax=Pedobacter sp. AW1-32 TaxID=3383026 RepID=UPI003FEE440E
MKKQIGITLAIILLAVCSFFTQAQTRACLITSGNYNNYVFGYNSLTGLYVFTDYGINYCPEGSTALTQFRRTTMYSPTETCTVIGYGTGVRVTYVVANCALDLNIYTVLISCCCIILFRRFIAD